MFTNDLFQFKTNVSLETYQSKTDATACLSSIGAAAIGKNKMAFMKRTVSIDDFLTLATSGHTFCNLFDYDPSKKYWVQSKDGKWYKEYPEYQKGANKGGMKLCMKSDAYFQGAQTVFVDVDYTRFDNVMDYASTLTYKPTCIYMSFSDRKEKQGRVSRRFRMVYVFDHILDKKEFRHVAQCINDRIVFDTSEPMDDECGTRMSQYMNGVYGNNEVYKSSIIYSVSDFPEEQPEWMDNSNTTAAPQQQGITFDEKMLNDMGNYNYDDFVHFYSWKYPYRYRTEGLDWIDGLYQFTDENYLQLWWYRERQLDGMNRRRKLFKNACLRRLMFPDMTPDAALYNLYIDFVRFFDNSDGVIKLDTLVRKVKNAFEKTPEQLLAYCDREIRYWKEHKPQFIIHPGNKCDWSLITEIRKRIHWQEIGNNYDRTLSVQQNLQNGLNVSAATLYRYCKENFIATNPNKTETEAERREAKRKEKQHKIEQFQQLYNPNVTVLENQESMSSRGLELSAGTISNWSHKYIVTQQQNDSTPSISIPKVSFEVPAFDNWFSDYDVDVADKYGNASSTIDNGELTSDELFSESNWNYDDIGVSYDIPPFSSIISNRILNWGYGSC